MASCIYLKHLKPLQEPMCSVVWNIELNGFRGHGDIAIIAKGNIIDGIEAMW